MEAAQALRLIATLHGFRFFGLVFVLPGVVGPGLLWRVAYLAVLGLAGLYASGRRIGKLMLV